MTAIKVAQVNDLEDGQAKPVQVGGKTLALIKQGGKFFALDNTCLHQGGPLGEGFVDGNNLVCPLHGWQYDIASGTMDLNPTLKVKTYPVKVQGNDVLVEI